jgi:nicotinate phosphoribosyltransferase
VYRIISRDSGKAEADYIALREERDVTLGERIKLFDPVHPYIHKYIEDYDAIKLLVPVFRAGELIYELPELEQIRSYHAEQLQLLWPEYIRKLNPEGYPVDLSTAAWELKLELIRQHTK